MKFITYAELEIQEERLEAAINKITWKERSVGCPVCREPIRADELHDFKADNQNSSSESEIAKVQISRQVRHLQDKMSRLFEKQKAAGGIIDPNENRQEVIVLTRPNRATNSNETSSVEAAPDLQHA